MPIICNNNQQKGKRLRFRAGVTKQGNTGRGDSWRSRSHPKPS